MIITISSEKILTQGLIHFNTKIMGGYYEGEYGHRKHIQAYDWNSGITSDWLEFGPIQKNNDMIIKVSDREWSEAQLTAKKNLVKNFERLLEKLEI